MSRWPTCIATLMVVVVLAPVLAAQSTDDPMQKAVSAYSAWMDELAKFTKRIEFDEGDVKTLIEHYAEMRELDMMEPEQDVTDPTHFQDSMQQVLEEPEYRAWASRNGLDPDRWLRTLSRISSVYMVVRTERSRPEAEAQQQHFEALVEEQCKQVDAETCRSMREALATNAAMSEAFTEAQGRLPPPTAEERALIDRYYDQLTATMTEDDGSSNDESRTATEQYDDSGE
jgi:hypothetical protein